MAISVKKINYLLFFGAITKTTLFVTPRVAYGAECVRIDPLRFLAGSRKR